MDEEELNRLLKADRDEHFASRGQRWLLPAIIFAIVIIALVVLGVSFRVNYVPDLRG